MDWQLSDADKQLLKKVISDRGLYFKSNLKIRTKSGAVRPLALNTAQAIVNQKLEWQLSTTGKIRAIILKGRQQGMSTYVAGRFYYRTATQKGIRTLIITHLDAATKNLFGMAKMYHDNSHPRLKPITGNNSAEALDFPILGSGYRVATAGSKNAGRSDTAQQLHGSEVAFWPNAAKIMAGIGQTVSKEPGTEVILESTADGLANIFHRLWQAAVSGKSEYMPIFIPWWIQTEYRETDIRKLDMNDEDLRYQRAFDLDEQQMMWRQLKIHSDFGGDVALFNQEYPACASMAFVRPGHQSIVNTLDVQKARNMDPASIRDVDRQAHIVGVDPARFGSDSTGIIHRKGRKAWGVERLHKKSTMQVAGHVARMLDKDPSIDMVFIDVGGLGAGVYDRLVEMGYGDRVTAVNFGDAAIDDTKYFNKRSEMWGDMGEWFTAEQNPTGVSIPDDDGLHADLEAPGYSYTSSQQIKLDPKEKIKKEYGKSPDSGDALALTFAGPVAPRTQQHLSSIQQRLNSMGRRSSMSA